MRASLLPLLVVSLASRAAAQEAKESPPPPEKKVLEAVRAHMRADATKRAAVRIGAHVEPDVLRGPVLHDGVQPVLLEPLTARVADLPRAAVIKRPMEVWIMTPGQRTAFEGRAIAVDGPLVHGKYADALDALDRASEGIRQAAGDDNLAAAIEQAMQAILRARGAAWEQTSRDGKPIPPAAAPNAEEQAAMALRLHRVLLLRAMQEVSDPAPVQAPHVRKAIVTLEGCRRRLRTAADRAAVLNELDVATKTLMAALAPQAREGAAKAAR